MRGRRVGGAAGLLAAMACVAAPLGAQSDSAAARVAPGRLSNAGVLRASAMVDSVFIDRRRPDGTIEAGDWASYLLARLDVPRIPDTLGIEVKIDTAHIEVRGRLQDLPAEARSLLGPLAAMVDSTSVVVADVMLQRTGREVLRFWLRGLSINGFSFPELLLAHMMRDVGRRYPALTASGRDLYVQVPADGSVTLVPGAVHLSAPPRKQ